MARNLKLLYIIDSVLGGGAEHSLLSMTPYYVKNGIDLEIAYLRERSGLQHEFEAAGAKLTCIDGRGGRIGWTRRARDLINEHRPDLVHTTLFESDIIGRTAARMAGVPVVSSLVNAAYGPQQFGNPRISPSKLRLAWSVDIMTARFGLRFHAITRFVAETMAPRLRIPLDRIDVIPRGRDSATLGRRSHERRARIRERIGIGADEPLILAAARQEYQKGLDSMIEALPLIREKLPGVRFLLAGRPGGVTGRLEDSVARLGLHDTVRFLGHRTDVPDLMAAADVFVLPSLWEGLAGSLIEAMALETPIVASDIAPIREVVGSDDAAMLVPVGQVTSFARAVVECLENPVRAAQMTAAAYRRFEEAFTVEGTTARMIDFYDQCLREVAAQNGKARVASSNGRTTATTPPEATPSGIAVREPLRLLYLIDSLVPGGAERSLAAVAPYYEDLGVSVTVAYLQERPGLQDEVRRGGARVVSLNGGGGRFGNVWRVNRFIADLRPQLLHTTLFEADISGRTAAAFARVPVVSTLPSAMYDREHRADPSVPRWRLKAAQAVDALTAQRVVRFHAVSGQVAEHMAAKLRIPLSRIDVIPRGRDPRGLGDRSPERTAAVRSMLALPSNRMMLLAVARQDHKKGLDVLLSAMPAVLRECPDVVLVIAGRSGGQTPLLQRRMDELKLHDNVRFLGAREDVPDLIAATDLFVLPSVSEGFPGALVEAMALEAPIVATDLPSTREMLAADGCGWMVPVRQPDVLAQGIIGMLHDRAAADEMAGRARDRFMRHYAIGAVAREMVAFYDRVMAQR